MEANRTRKGFVSDEVLQMVWDRVYEGKPNPVAGVVDKVYTRDLFKRD